MNNLPVEVKARIVELCNEADEAFKQKSKPQSPSTIALAAAPFLPSSASLARFSALAAPYMFKVLKASKADVAFKCAISLVRLEFFIELVIDTTDISKLLDILGYIPRMPKLKKVVLNRQTIERLYDYGPVSFKRDNYWEPKTLYAVEAFRGLKKIEELASRNYQGPSALDALGPSLSSVTKLERLELICTYASLHAPFDLSSLKADLFFPPHLRHLRISAAFLHSSHISFAHVFSRTLETLSFDSTYSLEVTSFTQASFRGLDFRASNDLLFGTLAGIKPLTFPSLTSLSLCLSGVLDWEGDDSPLDSFTTFLQLRELSIPNYSILSSNDKEAIAAFCEERGLLLSAPAFYAQRRVDEVYERDTAAEGLRTTLKYVEGEVDKAEGEGNSTVLARLKSALRSFEKERVAEELWRKV
ncbi:hypothetical protein JCM10213v2_000621 [Rhodosporidiobolus nylandii]